MTSTGRPRFSSSSPLLRSADFFCFLYIFLHFFRILENIKSSPLQLFFSRNGNILFFWPQDQDKMLNIFFRQVQKNKCYRCSPYFSWFSPPKNFMNLSRIHIWYDADFFYFPLLTSVMLIFFVRIMHFLGFWKNN